MQKRSFKPSIIALVLFETVFVAGLTAAGLAAVNAQVAVATYHYDNQRTGWNNQERALVASSFPSNFGIIARVPSLDGSVPPLDDQVDAQPLIVPSLTIAGGTHDVVYVATESNTVYAIDATSGAILLSKNLGRPVPMPLSCFNNGPNVGINGTPVIDPASQTLYVIAYLNGSPPTYQLHALNLSDLSDKNLGSGNPNPRIVAATHTLTNGSILSFNATYQRQRPGLLLQNGNIYAGFGGFCDFSANRSRGWLLGWNASTLTPLTANQLDVTRTNDPSVNPPFLLDSIWMSGYGIAGRGTDLFFATGNSDCNWLVNPVQCPPKTTWDGKTNIQESVVRLSGDLSKILSIFTPSTSPNTYALDKGDTDLGSGGVLLFPTANQSYPYLAAAAGKDGRLFLFNAQTLSTLPPNTSPPQGGDCHCGPSFFVGSDGINRIVTSQGSTVRTWEVPSSSPTLSLEASAAIASGQDGGFFTTVSSNGSQAGTAIIWAVGRPTPTSPNPTAVTLYAFAAAPPSGTTSLTQLFSAAAGSWPNTGGNANIVPVVANGKVYVASAFLDASGNTRGQLDIFGIGGTGTPLVSAVAGPASLHVISGTLTAVSGSTLTLATRSGKSATIDASQAINNLKVGAPLKVGVPFTVLGSTFEPTGALLATAIVRAKGSSGNLWPPDH